MSGGVPAIRAEAARPRASAEEWERKDRAPAAPLEAGERVLAWRSTCARAEPAPDELLTHEQAEVEEQWGRVEREEVEERPACAVEERDGEGRGWRGCRASGE